MHPRRKIGFAFLIVVGLVLGFAIKNIEAGLVLGLIIGLLAAGLVSKTKD